MKKRETPPANNPVANSKTLKLVDSISRTMDSRFTIPGTNFKFGLDPILGFIPVVGEAVTFSISSLLLLVMSRHGVSRSVIFKMVGNLLIDAIFGVIPIIGDIFDVWFKANNRNIKLLKEHYQEGKHQGSGTGLLIGVGLFLLLVLALIVFGLVKLFEWIF